MDASDAAVADGGGPGDGGGDAVAPPRPPLYAAISRVTTPAGQTSYLWLTPSIGPEVTLDPTRGIEIAGTAALYAGARDEFFSVGANETLTLRRFEVGAGDALIERGRLSLAGRGAMGFSSAGFVAVSPRKAYVWNFSALELVIIDPTAMEITGQVDMGFLRREGFLTRAARPVLRDGRVYAAFGWESFTNDDAVAGFQLVVVDTATDAIISQPTDARCSAEPQVAVQPDGTLLFASPARQAARFERRRVGTDACVLRVLPGQNTFDPAWRGEPRRVFGRAAGGIVSGPGGAVYAQVVDRAVLPDLATVPVAVVSATAAWRFWRWDLATGQTAEVASLPLAQPAILDFPVDGVAHIAQYAADFSRSVLVDFGGAAEPARAAQMPGQLFGVQRVR